MLHLLAWAGLLFPRPVTAITCENEVPDQPQLLGVSADSTVFVLRALRNDRESAKPKFGVMLYLCHVGGGCEEFEIAKPTNGDRPSPTSKTARRANLARAKEAIAAAGVQLGEPTDAFTSESDKLPAIPEHIAHKAGLAGKVSFKVSGGDDLQLQFGDNRLVTLQPAQIDLSEMGPYAVSGWMILSKSGELLVHGGYDDKLCRWGLVISSTPLRTVAAIDHNRQGLAAFLTGKRKQAERHFLRAIQQAQDYRPAQINLSLTALVEGDGKRAAEIFRRVRTLRSPGADSVPSTLCAWPKILDASESMDDGYASCPETFADDEYHWVGASKDSKYIALRRVIRKVSDEDEFKSSGRILGKANFGTQLYLCEVGGGCGAPFVISSPWGVPKKKGKAALRRAKKAFAAKGVTLSAALVFKPFTTTRGLLEEQGISGPVDFAWDDDTSAVTVTHTDFPTIRLAEFYGPITPLKLDSGMVMLVYRDPCDGLAEIHVIDLRQVAARLYHAKGIELLNKGEHALATTYLGKVPVLWPGFTRAKFTLALGRLLADDVSGAVAAVKALANEPQFDPITRRSLALCQ